MFLSLLQPLLLLPQLHLQCLTTSPSLVLPGQILAIGHTNHPTIPGANVHTNLLLLLQSHVSWTLLSLSPLHYPSTKGMSLLLVPQGPTQASGQQGLLLQYLGLMLFPSIRVITTMFSPTTIVALAQTARPSLARDNISLYMEY